MHLQSTMAENKATREVLKDFFDFKLQFSAAQKVFQEKSYKQKLRCLSLLGLRTIVPKFTVASKNTNIISEFSVLFKLMEVSSEILQLN